MKNHRRRRLFLVVLVGAGVAMVAAYRDRALRHSSNEFVDRYGR